MRVRENKSHEEKTTIHRLLLNQKVGRSSVKDKTNMLWTDSVRKKPSILLATEGEWVLTWTVRLIPKSLVRPQVVSCEWVGRVATKEKGLLGWVKGQCIRKAKVPEGSFAGF